MWQRPFLQSESCTRSQPSPASTSFSSPSWLDAPMNGENVRQGGWWIIFRFPSFNSPVASALFHHIWQHWPISCASSWNAFDWTLVFFSIKSEKTHMAIFPGGFCSFTFPLNIALLVLSYINIDVTTELLCKQSESSCSNLRYNTALEKPVKHEVVVHRLRHNLIRRIVVAEKW